MASRIQRPNLLPYRSAMEGAIPLEAMSRAYDRLDRITAATESATTKSLALLNEQKAQLAPGDERGRAFLEEQYGRLDAMSKQAAEENNVAGYARSIRKQIQALATDPRFAQIQQNVKNLDEYDKRKAQLIANGYTTIGVGRTPEEFQSIDENGNPVQFNSYVAREPDYKKAHQSVFRNVGTDVLDSKQALAEFVYGPGGDPGAFPEGTEGEDVIRGYKAYIGTPEGRIEQDQMARARHQKPFEDLTKEEKQEIALILSDRIYNDALPLVNTPRSGAGTIGTRGQNKDAPTGVVLGGPAASMITDGDETTSDQVFQEFDDMLDNTQLDRYLQTTYGNAQDQVALEDGELIPMEDFNTGQKQIGRVVMSTAGYNKVNGETGEVSTMPVIRVHYTEGSGANKTSGFIERPANEMDLDMMRGNMQSTLLQINSVNTPSETREGTLPMISHVFAPELGDILFGQATEKDIEKAGVKVVKEGDLYKVKDLATGRPYGIDGEPFASSDPGAVEGFIGGLIMDREIAGR